MKRWQPRQRGAMLLALLVFTGQALAQVRTWKDSSGKFSVEAEYVSAKAGKVRLRRDEDGKVITIPLERLSDDDRAFVEEQLDGTAAAKTEAAAKSIAKIASDFYADLRTKERAAARDALTAAGQELFKKGKSPLAELPAPDDNAKAIRVGKTKVEGDMAEVAVQVRINGEIQRTILRLRQEEEQWRVLAVSAVSDEEPEQTIQFETPAGGKPEDDPLAALVGQRMDLQGYTADGTALDMTKFKGKAVLVDFWATWCGPCRAEMPNILENYQKYHDAGFEVVAISVDQDLDELKKFMVQESPPWTVVVDNYPQNTNPMGARYGIRAIPEGILIGPDGNVAAVHVRGQTLGRRLAELLGEPKKVAAQN